MTLDSKFPDRRRLWFLIHFINAKSGLVHAGYFVEPLLVNNRLLHSPDADLSTAERKSSRLSKNMCLSTRKKGAHRTWWSQLFMYRCCASRRRLPVSGRISFACLINFNLTYNGRTRSSSDTKLTRFVKTVPGMEGFCVRAKLKEDN